MAEHKSYLLQDHTDSQLPVILEKVMMSAGALLLSFYNQEGNAHGLACRKIERKRDGSLVTSADYALQEFLINELSGLLPATFLSEEAASTQLLGASQSDGRPTAYQWVIDPLDGTTNFVYGIPYFGISVALTLHDEPVVAAIYNPVLGEYFSARQGSGAWLNGQRIWVSSVSALDDSLLFAGMPYGKGEAFKMAIARLEAVAIKAFSFRHLGAIALDLAYVACGRSDGVFFEGLSWWDVAAGILIVKEAGGHVSTYEGLPVGRDYTSFVGGNPYIHELLGMLVRHPRQGIFDGMQEV